MTKEPVLAGITALVVAAIGLGVAFGVNVTEAQTAAIVAFVAAVYAVAGIIRAKVTPTG